jgi:hypothetical protein
VVDRHGQGKALRRTGVGHGSATMTDLEHGWRVRVSADDVRAAHDAWLHAHDARAPSDRLRDLREELERIVRAHTLQSAGEA